jgi:hypothetical protein
MRTFLMTAIAGTAFAVALAVGAPANAAAISFKADLTGAQETPPTDSKGKGAVDAAYDAATKTLTWTITYSDLTGPAAAAHFHGPAAVGAKAAPVVPIQGDLKSPIKGNAALTDQQAKDLQAGMWYFNIHTAKFPDGEIRGQLTTK